MFVLCRYALKVQAYIQLHRLEFAEKEIDKMKAIDDDDALTALASSWLYIAKVSRYLMAEPSFHVSLPPTHTHSSTPPSSFPHRMSGKESLD